MIKQTIETLKVWAKRLKSEIYTLYVAMRDPRTPAHARYLAVIIIGYALSPIDLIPDFIPILGLLDDLILLPLGIALLRKMIPPIVMAASRRQADALIRSGLPASRNAAMIVMAIWALFLTACIWWIANQLVYPRSADRSADRSANIIEPGNFSTEETTPHPAGSNPTINRDTDWGRSRDR